MCSIGVTYKLTVSGHFFELNCAPPSLAQKKKLTLSFQHHFSMQGRFTHTHRYMQKRFKVPVPSINVSLATMDLTRTLVCKPTHPWMSVYNHYPYHSDVVLRPELLTAAYVGQGNWDGCISKQLRAE